MTQLKKILKKRPESVSSCRDIFADPSIERIMDSILLELGSKRNTKHPLDSALWSRTELQIREPKHFRIWFFCKEPRDYRLVTITDSVCIPLHSSKLFHGDILEIECDDDVVIKIECKNSSRHDRAQIYFDYNPTI